MERSEDRMIVKTECRGEERLLITKILVGG